LITSATLFTGNLGLEQEKMGPLVFFPYIPFIAGDVVSIVGSGGKTTLMYHLAHELVKKGNKVITTTTTKIFPPHPSESPQLILSDKEEVLLNKTQKLIQKEKHVTIAESFIGPKLKGLPPTFIDKIQKQKIADVILVEADGAKHCPLKAPNENEPVIPSSTTWTLPVVGLDGVGKINTKEYVFRPNYFSRLTGIKEGEIITPDSVAKVILHPEGLVRGTPIKARILPILNKGEIEGGLDVGTKLALLILEARRISIVKILITSLKPTPKVLMVFNPDQAM